MAARADGGARFKIIAIVDTTARCTPHGLDIERLMEHRADTGFITGLWREDIDKRKPCSSTAMC